MTVGNVADLFDMRVEQAEGVGAGHHDRRHFIVHGFFEKFQIHVAIRCGRHGDDLIPGDGCRGGVGAVRRVRNYHVFLFGPVAPGCVVSRNQHDAGHLAMGAGQRLGGNLIHAGNVRQHLPQIMQHPQSSLAQCHAPRQKRCHGVVGCEQGGGVFQHFGVIFHGAGTERVEVGIHRKIAPGKIGKMAHQIKLGNLSQAGTFLTKQGGGKSGGGRYIRCRQSDTAPTGDGLFINQLHNATSSSLTNRSISFLVRFSVTVTTRQFSAPA